jgi:hypothetical protein
MHRQFSCGRIDRELNFGHGLLLEPHSDLNQASLHLPLGGTMQATSHFLDDSLAIGRVQLHQELAAMHRPLVVF